MNTGLNLPPAVGGIYYQNSDPIVEKGVQGEDLGSRPSDSGYIIDRADKPYAKPVEISYTSPHNPTDKVSDYANNDTLVIPQKPTQKPDAGSTSYTQKYLPKN